MTSTLPPLAQAISGAIGAASANVGSYPLDLVTTKLQTSRSKRKPKGILGVIRVLENTINKKGYASLFDGLETDTSATIISNFFYFYLYSYLRARLVRRNTKASTSLSALEELAVGFVAGVGSRAVSSPLSMITTRLQSGEDEEDDGDVEKGENKNANEPVTVTSIVKHVYQNDGVLGFWKGFKTTILLCSNPAITLFLFQAFRRLFLPSRTKDNPTPAQGFVGGALSNSIAVCLLYPLMLAKTRLQTSPPDAPNHTLIGVLKDAYRRENVRGMYQGLEAQVLKGFLNQGLTIMIKQRVERIMLYLYLRYASRI